MKRLFTVLCMILCFCCLFSCAATKERDAYDDFVAALTADGVNPIHLTEQQVTTMEGNISKLIELEGKILKVCQIQRDKIFAYVIECELESDAQKLCAERSEKNFYTEIYGNVVVYGNNEAINDLK